MMYRYGHMMGNWGYPLMMMSTLAVCVLVVVVVVVATRVYLGGRRISGPAATPDQVLALRFARGDIDQDEFDRGRAALAPTRSSDREIPDQ